MISPIQIISPFLEGVSSINEFICWRFKHGGFLLELGVLHSHVIKLEIANSKDRHTLLEIYGESIRKSRELEKHIGSCLCPYPFDV